MSSKNICYESKHYENVQQRAFLQTQISNLGRVLALSDPGGREENQDAWGLFETTDGGYALAVADGLGGHEGGRQASQAAIQGVREACCSNGFSCLAPASLDLIFTTAQRSIRQKQQQNPALEAMRSTLVVALFHKNQAVWGHVGDVRCYGIRKGQVWLQTKDHSVPQMMVDTGEISADQVRGHADRSRLLQALGKPDDHFRVTQSKPTKLHNNDIFLLCTDGFWEWITEKELEKTLHEQSFDNALSYFEQQLSQRAQASDDYDNYSAVLLQVEQKGFLARFFTRDANHE
ncbi:PP2C family protein-serine/threonine phosphatase [Aliidiomarina celeris]|uniref:PP2C family protein-serine/threonine phosphatase n=1 Tax=Aliidiomarina celeris TaxID=2249428 RepID=UPI000DE95113|nr:protein phosphatase 2C domain-containing protein [Aliidiomarina celeris]